MEPTTNLAAQLFEQAQAIQDELKDLQSRLSNVYNLASKLKHLTNAAVDKLNDVEPDQETA